MAVTGQDAGAGAGNEGNAGQGGGTPPVWTDGLAPELGELVKTKGWKNPGEALTSYAALEKIIPADKVVVPAADADPKAWDEVYGKLGRPEAPDKYELKLPADAKEIGYDDKLAGWFRSAAHKTGLNTRQAAAMHDEFTALQRQQVTEAVAKIETDRKAAMAALDTKWGAQAAAKKEASKMAMKALGGEEFARYLDATGLGDDPQMIATFANIAEKIGEDGLKGDGAKLGLSLSQKEAEAEIKKIRGEAMTNPKHALMDKLHPEHQALVDRIDQLSKIAYPEQAAA